MLRQQGGVPDGVALTMVAVKILHTFFASDQKLWTLVEKKAVKFVTATSSLGSDSFRSVNPMFSEYKP